MAGLLHHDRRREKTLWAIAPLSLAAMFACYIAVRTLGAPARRAALRGVAADGGYPTSWDRPLTFVTYLGDTWVATFRRPAAAAPAFLATIGWSGACSQTGCR